MHADRLLQSMVLEPESHLVVRQVVETVPIPLLQCIISSSPSAEVYTEATYNLIMQIQSLARYGK